MSSDPSINAALLNLCTSLPTDGSHSVGSSQPRCSADDLQWLRNAVAAVEPPERLIRRLLETVDRADVCDDDCVAALDELAELVEDINWAVEFTLMDGPARTLRLLRERPAAAVRRSAAMVVAHAAQLNEKVQRGFDAARWAETLLPLLQREKERACVAALLHACSCVCRDDAANTAQFVGAGGVRLLMERIAPNTNSGDAKIVRRALFLVTHLVDVGALTVDGEIAQRVCQALLTAPETREEEEETNIGEAAVETQREVARALVAMAKNNAIVVREAIQTVMAGVFAQWKSAVLDEDDNRRVLIDVLEKGEHDG